MRLVNSVRKNKYITIPLFKWKRTKEYNRFRELLKESENWTPAQTDQWQLKHVSAMVDYAFAHVPAYRKLYMDVGYEKGAIHSWADFEKLPFVSKDEIKAHFSDFCSDEKVRSYKAFTSGSTGKPMCFLLDTATGERERALFHYYWNKYHYEFGKKCILLRGQNVGKPEKKIFYEYDRFQNYKMFNSTFVCDPANLDIYDIQMKAFHADFMQAYPSALLTFAKLHEVAGKPAPQFRSIFLGSESVTPEQCDFIQKIFGAERVMYHYGHSECAVLALKYSDKHHLGFVPVYGYAEIINNGKKCPVGESGEIVATGFNKSMPFIRYRTGDYTRLSNYQSDDFMKNYKAVDLIEGRKQEYIVTETYRLIPIVWLCGQHMEILDKIIDFQYRQDEVGKLTIDVVCPFFGEDEKAILSQIQKQYQQMFDDLQIEVKSVKGIAKNPRGKRIAMIQNLDTDLYR